MSLIRNLLSGALALAIATGAGIAAGAAEEKLKIGFVYPSPVGDVGWAHELDEGRKKIVEAYGDKVEAVTAENIPEGPDAARIMNQMIADGAKMLMIGSFGYMNDGLKLAKQHPEVAFIHASGYKLAPNFGNFQTRNYESAYIGGIAAGSLTKSKVLGVVAAYPIPEVVGIINAFTLGAQKVAPDVTVKVVWLNSWFDPNKSQESARSLVAQNADVLFSLYQDTPEVVTLAEELGVYVLNTSSDMAKYAPKKYLMGMTIDWGPHFVAEVGKVLDGKFEGTAYWGGMKDGAVGVGSLTADVPAPAKALIDEAVAAMKAGTFHPLTGPVLDQDGAEKLAAGAVIADGDLLGINWLVKGVETRIPQ
ncbi:BMP family ABC transporter substrate-binding protein [Chthonobacter albigriseus]|uniref:BMP family ABC transporter substrate-binding protein n=1 Tax=Chthonobacter albigriseus TaxID=1683161 RepID=UPI0015EFCF6A|nr:BMP family ABC transporter substrate-binding protein [Chthonobacter albigriseus]